MHTDSRRAFVGLLAGGLAALLSRAARAAAGDDQILSLSAAALAQQIRARKISAVESVLASIARIQAVNFKLNAVSRPASIVHWMRRNRPTRPRRRTGCSDRFMAFR
jgi:hypothetical protein